MWSSLSASGGANLSTVATRGQDSINDASPCTPALSCPYRYSGKLLHIDFGDCFEASMNREKFPEKVRVVDVLVVAGMPA
jgi:hypothetical protein